MSDHVSDVLSAYLDAALEDEDEAAVREHLAGCSQCQDELEELRAVDRLARSATEPALPADGTDLATRVRARLLAEASRRPRRATGWLAAAAALAAVTVLPWLLLQQGGQVVSDTWPEEAPVKQAPAAAAPPARTSGPRPVEESSRGTFATEPKAAVPALRREKKAEEQGRSGNRNELDRARDVRALEETTAREGDVTMMSDSAPAAEIAPAAPPAPQVARRDAEAHRAGGSFGSVSAASGAGATTEADAFRLLASRSAATREEARRLREDWRSFLRRFPTSPHFEEARFAMLEAGALACRLGGPAEDLERLRRDVDEYRRRATPEQDEAARHLLEEAQRSHSP